MKKEIKDGILKGFEIGEEITIHANIYDTENWYVTIRKLKVFCEFLCKRNCTEAEIARYVNVLLHKKIETINELIKDVIPFT
jgi:hypothetical protein